MLSLLQFGLNHLQAVLKTHRLLICRLHTRTIAINTWAEKEEEKEQEEEEGMCMPRPVHE